jgi:hypothetical protein
MHAERYTGTGRCSLYRGLAHCTGGWRTVLEFMHWYRGLYAGTGVCALVPEFVNGAPRIRLPLIDAPPVSGGGDYGIGTPPPPAPSVDVIGIDADDVPLYRRIHSSVYAHWPVCTVYTLYSVYVQCTVYTLYSVTIVYTVQCIARVYTDQCMRCLVCTVVQWQCIPTMSLCTVAVSYTLYSDIDIGRKKVKIVLEPLTINS